MPKRQRPSDEPAKVRRIKRRVEETLDYWTEETMGSAEPLSIERSPRTLKAKDSDDGRSD
jgi:hypothetical protein